MSREVKGIKCPGKNASISSREKEGGSSGGVVQGGGTLEERKVLVVGESGHSSQVLTIQSAEEVKEPWKSRPMLKKVVSRESRCSILECRRGVEGICYLSIRI